MSAPASLHYDQPNKNDYGEEEEERDSFNMHRGRKGGGLLLPVFVKPHTARERHHPDRMDGWKDLSKWNQ